MMTRSTVIQLNNQAAAFIESGHCKSAIQLLRKANRMVVVTLEAEHQAREGTNESGQQNIVVCYDCTGNIFRRTRMLDECPVPSKTQCSSTGTSPRVAVAAAKRRRNSAASAVHQHHEEAFVYQRPIVVTTQLPKSREYYILSVILLFNMALCYHLLAIRTMRKNPCVASALTTDNKNSASFRLNLLREALKLYQLAFVMKNRGNLHFDTTFVLAMVNNTAHIQNEMGRVHRAKKLQDLMMSTLMMVVDNGQSAMIQDMDGFMWTASLEMSKGTLSGNSEGDAQGTSWMALAA